VPRFEIVKRQEVRTVGRPKADNPFRDDAAELAKLDENSAVRYTLTGDDATDEGRKKVASKLRAAAKEIGKSAVFVEWKKVTETPEVWTLEVFFKDYTPRAPKVETTPTETPALTPAEKQAKLEKSSTYGKTESAEKVAEKSPVKAVPAAPKVQVKATA